MVTKYKVRSADVQYYNILVLLLEPVSPEDKFDFYGGQYAAFSFKRFGRRTPARCFSLASSPTDKVVRLAMRISGKFTRAATHLKPGDTVYLQGPYGNFVLDQDDTGIVMLACGIGITPFLSMIRLATSIKLNTPMTLVYSNRSAGSTPFYEELESLAANNPKFEVSFLASDGSNKDKVRGGVIDETYIEKLTDFEYQGSTYMICGPSGFITKVHDMLVNRGVGRDKIITESFSQKTTNKEFEGFTLSPSKATYAVVTAAFLLIAGLVSLIDLHSVVEQSEAQMYSTTSDQSSSTGTVSQSSLSGNSSSSAAQNTTTTPSASSSTQTNTQPTQQYYSRPRSRMS